MLREPGVYDAKLHRYVYANPADAPKVQSASTVAVAEDRPKTRRDQWMPKAEAEPKPKRVDRRTKAYKAKQAAAVKESDDGQLPDNDGTADTVPG